MTVLLFAIAAFMIAALLSASATAGLIFAARRFGIGQPIRSEGPAAHQKKSGTPPVGGLGVWAAALITMLIFVDLEIFVVLFIVMTTLLFGLGFLDDILKLVRRKNEGLEGRHKLAGQAITSLIFLIPLLTLSFSKGTPSLPDFWHTLPAWLYVAFGLFVIMGTANAANLTDGLDGLLAGVSLPVLAVLSAIALATSQREIALLGIAAAGTLLGFLVFNRHPARIFLGDAGAFWVGGTIAGMAILLHQEWLLAVIGAVFVIETVSVMVQVAGYKLWKIRVFKMAPLHHHLELQGWSEPRVVQAFWAASWAAGAAGWLIFRR